MSDQFIAAQEQSRKKAVIVKKVSKVLGYSIVIFCVLLSGIIVLRLNNSIRPDILPTLIISVLVISSVPTLFYLFLMSKQDFAYKNVLIWIGAMFIVLSIGLVIWYIY